MEKHQLNIEVKKEHLDELRHVNNVVYLQWVQDVAASHWFEKAGKDSGVFWVVRKHEIEYLSQAFENDELTLITWVEKMAGLSSYRRVEIKRGNELICRCLSQWIMLDAQTMRPKRIPENWINMFQ